MLRRTTKGTHTSQSAQRTSVRPLLKKTLAILMCTTLLFGLAGCKKYEPLDLSDTSNGYTVKVRKNRSCWSFSVLWANGSIFQEYDQTLEKVGNTSFSDMGKYYFRLDGQDRYVGNKTISLDRDTEYYLYSYFWGYLPNTIAALVGSHTFTNEYVGIVIPPLSELHEKYANMDVSKLKFRLSFAFNNESDSRYSLAITLEIKEKGGEWEQYNLDWESIDPSTLPTR